MISNGHPFPIQIFDSSLAQRQPLAASMLTSAVAGDKLANAYVLTGRNSADKWQIAKELSCYLNCLSRLEAGGHFCLENAAGGKESCQNCRWILAGQHPQAWLVLENETGKTSKIPVEKARLLVSELAKTSQFVRTILVPDANQEIFHRPAANALLKTIEEPGAGCLFFLFALHAEDVLPTVLSRCQLIPLMQAESCHMSRSEASGQESGQPDFRRVSLSEAMAWASRLLDKMPDGLDVQAAIDLVVSNEMKRLSDKAAEDQSTSLYLKRFIQLAEQAKEQIEHFVQPKFAIQSLAISWQQLGLSRSRED